MIKMMIARDKKKLEDVNSLPTKSFYLDNGLVLDKLIWMKEKKSQGRKKKKCAVWQG